MWFIVAFTIKLVNIVMIWFIWEYFQHCSLLGHLWLLPGWQVRRHHHHLSWAGALDGRSVLVIHYETMREICYSSIGKMIIDSPLSADICEKSGNWSAIWRSIWYSEWFYSLCVSVLAYLSHQVRIQILFKFHARIGMLVMYINWPKTGRMLVSWDPPGLEAEEWSRSLLVSWSSSPS